MTSDELWEVREKFEALRQEKDAEIERLREALEEREIDMHSRIREGYDKTVADSWRDENERLRLRCEGYQASRDWAVTKLAGALGREPGTVRALEFYARLAEEEIEKLRAECMRLSHAEAEAMAVVLGLEERVEKLRTEVDRLESSPMSEEALDILRSENARLRAVINDNVPKLITVTRLPNQEHVADAHNRALAELLKVTQ